MDKLTIYGLVCDSLLDIDKMNHLSSTRIKYILNDEHGVYVVFSSSCGNLVLLRSIFQLCDVYHLVVEDFLYNGCFAVHVFRPRINKK